MAGKTQEPVAVKAPEISADELKELNDGFEDSSPQEVLAWALDRFHPGIALASSFGAEDVALIDMLVKINPQARVFSLDTGRLNQETYDVMDRVREKYGITIEVFCPNTEAVENMVREHRFNLFYDSVELRRMCCEVRKVEPLGRALKGLDVWITGLRRDQAATRAEVDKLARDEAHGGILKLNPLADWTWDQVWAYIREHKVPYNALHDRGFPSIGCEPCTRAVEPGEDPRAGRWWWEQEGGKKECGLHQ
jgi:phosphoadenosine phosphosulfate reductase